jgi:ABC-2 type transport system ATP-binding protein
MMAISFRKKKDVKKIEDLDYAVKVDSVTKKYRISHEKIPSLKNTILKLKRTTFEEFLALDNVSIEIKKGEAFGIIGPNGSGKSTALKLISRIIRPEEGTISVNGTISALLELGAGFHPDLTGKENIYINAAILGLSRKEVDRKFDEIVAFSELDRFIDTPVKNYSSGMYMRLGFSVAINVNPDILLVDEVLAVGDQSFQAKCYKVIYDFIKRGKTIIIVSHDLETISDLCNRVVFLNKGKIQEIGNPLKVVTKYREHIEELEKNRIAQEQKNERKTIFKTLIEEKRKITDGMDINEISALIEKEEGINRFGSGDAEITKVQITDKNKKSIDFAKFGDDIIVSAEVKFIKTLEDPIFGFRVTDYKGNIVYGTNSRLNDVKSGIMAEDQTIRVDFALHVNLIGGLYYITIAVGYKDGCTYCDWVNNIATLNVISNNKAEGVADLNAKIEIEKL